MAERCYDGREGAGAKEGQRNWRRRDLGDMVRHRMECLSHGGGVVGRNALVIALMRESRIHQDNVREGEKGGFGRWCTQHRKKSNEPRGCSGCQCGCRGYGAESQRDVGFYTRRRSKVNSKLNVRSFLRDPDKSIKAPFAVIEKLTENTLSVEERANCQQPGTL